MLNRKFEKFNLGYLMSGVLPEHIKVPMKSLFLRRRKMKKYFVLSCMVVVLLAVMAPFAVADTAKVYATDWALYGGLTSLWSCADYWGDARVGMWGGEIYWNYLKFDIPDLGVAAGDITSVTFNGYMIDRYAQCGLATYYCDDDSWSTADPDPAIPYSDLGLVVMRGSGADVPPDPAHWVVGEDISRYLLNTGEGQGSELTIRLDSIANDARGLRLNPPLNLAGGGYDEALRPYLEITYIPEPATISLLGLGALALIRRSKRQ